jgi:hypothetical protein
MKIIFKVLVLSLLVVGTAKPLNHKDDELARTLQLSIECNQAKAENKENQESICEQLKRAEDDINAHLRKIAQLEQEQQKVSEALTWGPNERRARNNLLESREYINDQNALESFGNGTITEEEKDAIHYIMLQSDVYARYLSAPDEEKKNRTLYRDIWEQLKSEPDNLKAIVQSRNFTFENDIQKECFILDKSKRMKKINVKFPIDYAVEELDKILVLRKDYNEALYGNSKAADAKKSAEYNLAHSNEMKNYIGKQVEHSLGLITKEDLENEAKKFEESDVLKKCELSREKFDNAEKRKKELHEQLVSVLKAPSLRQNK